MSPVSLDTHWANKEAPLLFSGMELPAINRLLDRDWFKRLWIWQEVKLALEAIVMCGTDILSWLAIQDAVFSIYVKSWAQYHNIIGRICNYSTVYAKGLKASAWISWSRTQSIAFVLTQGIEYLLSSPFSLRMIDS